MLVYVETTVWSFAFADDSPDFTKATLQFFDECRAGKLRPAASPVVIKELGQADPPTRERLLGLFAEINPEIIRTEPPVTALADAFLRLGVVPPSKPDDAMHVAAAFAAQCDVLVSWNFKHITNIRRAEKFNAVARLHGYVHPLTIAIPSEVLDAPG